MLVIFFLSSQSHPLPIVTEHVWDKLLHFIEYAVLGARGTGPCGEKD